MRQSCGKTTVFKLPFRGDEIGHRGNRLLPFPARSTVAQGQMKAAKSAVGSPANIPASAHLLTCGKAQPCPTVGERSRR